MWLLQHEVEMITTIISNCVRHIPPGILIMQSSCTCRCDTFGIILVFLDLEEIICNGIVAPKDIGRPLNERIMQRHKRTGGEDA